MPVAEFDTIAGTDWHLVLCKPNRNRIACRHLARMGVAPFMPLEAVERRARGKARVELRPVFAGYVFIDAGARPDCWRRIRATPGVAQLVGLHGVHGGAPARVPGMVVAGLMARCDADGVLRPDTDFAPGERVRITSGPFADFVARIEHVDATRRVHLLLDLLGTKTPVSLDPARAVRTQPG